MNAIRPEGGSGSGRNQPHNPSAVTSTSVATRTCTGRLDGGVDVDATEPLTIVGIVNDESDRALAKPCALVKSLSERGLFGDVYYAEGEYLHELKGLNEITKWRRTWQTGIDGVTYGTPHLLTTTRPTP